MFRELILRGLVNILGFIIIKGNRKNIYCTVDTVLIADLDRNLTVILDKVVKANKKKRLIIKWKNEYLIVRKRDST